MSVFRKVADYLRKHGRIQGHVYTEDGVCLVGGFAGVWDIHMDNATSTGTVIGQMGEHCDDLKFLSKVIQADESARSKAANVDDAPDCPRDWIVSFNDDANTSTEDVLDLLEDAARQREILEDRSDSPKEIVPKKEEKDVHFQESC